MSSLEPRLHTFWIRHRLKLLQIIAVLMAFVAVLKLGAEFYRLIWDSSPIGAVDLNHLHRWVTAWFEGQPIFQKSDSALYPPATYVMLWPLLGWMSLSNARWCWAATSIGALVGIIMLTMPVSGAATRRERMFVALLLLSINGTGVAIGNGQLISPVLFALLAGALVLDRSKESLSFDFGAAGLLTWAMIKPSVAAPFLWPVLFGWKRWRTVLLVLLIYAVLTLVAVAFQRDDLLVLLKLCLAKASVATTRFPGTRNIHALLVAAGLEKWMAVCSAAMFAVLGIWTYRYRRADRWVLIAVAALVARLWTYHRVYDDVLIFLPELALFRIAKQNSVSGKSIAAEILLAMTALAMLCPARLLDPPLEWAWTSQWAWIFTGTQTILWLLILGYLLNFVRCNGDRSIETQSYSLSPTISSR